MDNSATIQKRAFLSAIIILFSLLVITGIVTYFIPSGSYQYEEIDGVTRIIPDTFSYTNEGNLPFYRIFTAPFEIFISDGNAIVIAIILFLLIIGGSINVLIDVNIIEHLIFKIITTFHHQKYLLLYMITFIFMSIGAFIGVFEEVVPLVPIMIVLSKKLGWDVKIGLGMSILAAGFGFSAAITNPFTIGVAQQLASLPLFSGMLYRFVIFIITYLVLTSFLVYHAKKIDQHNLEEDLSWEYSPPKSAAFWWTILWFIAMVISIILSPFIPFLQDYNLILIALYFLIAGLGAGLLSYGRFSLTLKTFVKGSLDMAPGVILIMLATGVKHLITTSGVMDTILYQLVTAVEQKDSFTVILGAFFFTLIANFFIGSGSAKAFLIIPILNPLLDLSNISRQLGVLAFQLGDGFSNMFYPTNAVLLVALGLGSFGYTKWFKWTLLLQLTMILLSILFLYIGLQGGY